MYTGRDWIAELGIYEYRNRMYLPELGRFLQVDPIGFEAGDMNLFRYCGDDPVDRTDPLGLDWAVIDSETESWALRASAQDRAARKSEGRSLYRTVINMGRHSEFGTTVYRDNGKVGMSSPYTDRDWSTVRPRNYPGKTSLLYDHTHNHNRDSRVTKSHLSVPDIRVANNFGVPVQVTTPNGDVDRVRPSTAATRDGRWSEGATIERQDRNTKKFETLKGANTNVPRYGPVGEGMADISKQHRSAPSARDIDFAHQSTGVPSLGQESVNFAPGRP
jgi:RHS repeat-associated protein